MKALIRSFWILPAFSLMLTPIHAATPSKAVAHANAQGRVVAIAKVKAKAKSKVRVKVTKPSRHAPAVISFRADPVNESSLDSDVAAARKVVTVKSNDVEARERLARASVVLIDWVLRSEAVGDSQRSERLVQKLKRDLHDTGWRVHNMSQRGDMMAKQAAGFLLGRGILLKQDQENSCAEFIAAAEKLAPAGWHAAQCLMATSPDKAWAQMARSAQRGHAAAQEWMGRRCLGEFGGTEKNFPCARNYLSQSASLGRPRAQTLLAFLLTTGQGGAAEIPRAVGLYKAAADQGDVDALNNLGELYETGRGVAINLEEAIRWYERAAEKGLGSAQFNAGRLWAIGVGTRRDPTKARAFLTQAEDSGISQARQVLDWLDRQLPEALEESRGLKPASSLAIDPSPE